MAFFFFLHTPTLFWKGLLPQALFYTLRHRKPHIPVEATPTWGSTLIFVQLQLLTRSGWWFNLTSFSFQTASCSQQLVNKLLHISCSSGDLHHNPVSQLSVWRYLPVTSDLCCPRVLPHPCRLPYNQYFGGVSSMSKEQYLKINGFPNNYWGWGGEDDDIYNR